MKRTVCVAAALIVLWASSVSASPVHNPKFHAAPGRFAPGEVVSIVLVNEGTTDVTMGKTWDLSYRDGDGTAFYQWPDDQLVVAPGEQRVWQWDQLVNQCYGECQNVRAGDPAQAGRYEVTTTVDGNEETARFSLGQYFTLGFESRPGTEFSVFAASQPEVDRMTAEASASDKTLIVSGVVRKGRTYNGAWNFSMGPRSIVLGEVFIEVCDASPYYVQRHRSEWLGERWCPWSSFVESVGR